MVKYFFNRETLKEIYTNLSTHKIRTALTSFGIAWGIFILVVLLGISGGVKEGVFSLFKGFTHKTIWFYGGYSEENSALRSSGEAIRFTLSDLEILKENFPEIESVSPEIVASNYRIKHDFDVGYFNVYGSFKETFFLKNLRMKSGRKLNENDFYDTRQVVILGNRVANYFFKQSNPVGETIEINEVDFIVVGVLDSKSILSVNEQNNIFVPHTTFEKIIRPVKEVHSFGIEVRGSKTKNTEARITAYLARIYSFSTNNSKALYVVNYEDQMSAFTKFFKGFNLFLIFVGICLLLSGIVGVSNVMYIIVKERTQEIGIKKALGATSSVILSEVVFESLILTMLSGILGLFGGFGILKIIDLVLAGRMENEQFISKTVLEPQYLIFAFVILTFSGLVAGFFPAHKAASVRPVEAIQSL